MANGAATEKVAAPFFVNETVDRGAPTGSTVGDNAGLRKRSGKSNFGVWGAPGPATAAKPKRSKRLIPNV